MKRLIFAALAVLVLAGSALACGDTVATSINEATVRTAAVQTAIVQWTETALVTEAWIWASTLTPTDIVPPSVATFSAITESCVPRATQKDIGTVVAIVDGDTIDVEIDNQEFRVRYIGIDTPERGKPLSVQATLLNQNLVSGKKILLVKDISETDRYGRLLRYVFVGDLFVNWELVRQGYALVATFPPDVTCAEFLVYIQTQAQIEKAGLWASILEPINNNCDPSYPTVCIPSPPPDLDCPNISYRNFQVLPPDPHRFDKDGDGLGCEN